ncbi:hypothetical protein LX36DRAFT_662311 [Colletotrichum falcatum]|nr:hypothetical protein LX36DRAFT_662311 [Colletotrichum falcatum]
MRRSLDPLTGTKLLKCGETRVAIGKSHNSTSMESNAAPQDRSCPVAEEIAATRTSMPLLFSINKVLKGHKSTYTIVKELYRAADEGAGSQHKKMHCQEHSRPLAPTERS